MFKIVDGRDCFYQWDLNRQIKVGDNTINELHFCNKTDDCSLVVEVVNGVANVPNLLLQTDWDIRVYGYCADYTKIEKRFKVVARTKPADYVYTETEIKNYDDLQKEIDALREQVENINPGENKELEEKVEHLEEQVDTVNNNIEYLYGKASGYLPGAEQVVLSVDEPYYIYDLVGFPHEVAVSVGGYYTPKNLIHINNLKSQGLDITYSVDGTIIINGTINKMVAITIDTNISLSSGKDYYASMAGRFNGYYNHPDGMYLELTYATGEVVSVYENETPSQIPTPLLTGVINKVVLMLPAASYNQVNIQPTITSDRIKVYDAREEVLLATIPLCGTGYKFNSGGATAIYIESNINSDRELLVSYHRHLAALVDEYYDNGFVFRWGERYFTVADSGLFEEALDRIIEIQESLMVSTITFEIEPYGTYVAINGMTWAEWCDSVYNTDGYHCEDGVVYAECGDRVGYEGLEATPNDLIVDGRAYDGGM